MNIRKTAVLAAILGGLVWYIRSVEEPKEAAKLRASQPFHGMPLEQISAIEIVRAGAAFRLVNDRVEAAAPTTAPAPDALASASIDRAKSWRLADVPNGALDKGAINSLLNSIAGFALDKAIPADELEADRAVYGLADPALKVTVKRGGETVSAAFGALNEYVSKRYVEFGGQTYLAADGLYTAANKPRDDFRSRHLLDFADSDLKGLTLTSPRGEIKFALNDQYRWRIEQPTPHAASDAAMANLGRELRSITAAEFIDSPAELETYGLAAPLVSAALEFKDGRRSGPVKLEIGAPRGAAPSADIAFARIAGQPGVFKLYSDPMDAIAKTADEFRERALFRFAVERVEDVTLEPKDGEKLALVRAGEEWQVNGQPGDAPFVREFIKNLAAVEADSFVTAAQARGLDAPALKVTVTLGGQKAGDAPVKRVLIVGGRSMDGKVETGYYAGVDDLSEPFVIGPEKFKLLSPRREALVKTTAEMDGPAEEGVPSIESGTTGE